MPNIGYLEFNVLFKARSQKNIWYGNILVQPTWSSGWIGCLGPNCYIGLKQLIVSSWLDCSICANVLPYACKQVLKLSPYTVANRKLTGLHPAVVCGSRWPTRPSTSNMICERHLRIWISLQCPVSQFWWHTEVIFLVCLLDCHQTIGQTFLTIISMVGLKKAL